MARRQVSSLEEFVEGCGEQQFFVGVDVHARSYHVALRRSDGLSHVWVAPAAPRALVHRIVSLGVRVEAVAHEAGPTGFGLAREVEGAGLRAIVAAPSRIPRPVAPGAKTDRLDCLKLAAYAAKGMLKPIAVPNVQEEARRTLLRRRHQIVDDLRKTKQRIKSLLLYLGVEEPAGLAHWSIASVKALEFLPIEPDARETMVSHLRTLSFFQKELQAVEARLAQSLEQDQQEVMRCLRSVPGVGAVVASTFRLEIYRPERFARAEEVTSYLGLAPMVSQSGESKARGHLRPVGQRRLRSLLVEAAWMWKSKDSWAQGVYHGILSRCGLPQKAIVALARKLAVILWRLSLEKRPYRPFAPA
jgi:transposase